MILKKKIKENLQRAFTYEKKIARIDSIAGVAQLVEQLICNQ